MVSVCAMLEEAGYRKHEIPDLNRWYVLRVLSHRRDDKGKLVSLYKDEGEAPLSRLDQVKATLLRRKIPAHKVEAMARRMIAEQDTRQAEKGRRKGR